MLVVTQKTAEELKENGRVEAKKFESVTVLFSDFVGFTKLAEHLEPEQVIKSIDFYFKEFDKITTKYSLEKIKTIGDAYMCTGGLISKGPMQPIKVIQAAFEILDFVKKDSESGNDDIAHFDVRIGINTGPVVAGVVGKKKFAYDIWGDTVNIASRMESNSEAGKINISQTTYDEVKEKYIPYIVETSAGCDRTILTVLADAFEEMARDIALIEPDPEDWGWWMKYSLG